MKRSIFVALTYHGRGHIALTAPLLHALHERLPESTFTIESAAPKEVLASHIAVDFEQHATTSDFGLLMDGSLNVRKQATHRRYAKLHASLRSETEAVMRRMQQCEPSLVLSNAGYIPLLAARRLGIPSVGFCCLNWAEIYRAVCGDLEGADRIYAQMISAYSHADIFIRPQPFIAMPGLDNLADCGPIARRGENIRYELLRRLALPPDQRLVTVFMGGIETQLDFEGWPAIPGVTWLFNSVSFPERHDFFGVQNLPFSYIDIAASSDALISKLGYGTVTEAACNGIPLLYLRRTNWPEDAPFSQWLSSVGRCREIHQADLRGPALRRALEELLDRQKKPCAAPTGIPQASRIIEELMWQTS